MRTIKILEKLAVLLIVIGLVGAAADAATAGSNAQANIFDSVRNFFRRSPFSPAPANQPIPLYQPAIDYEAAVVAAVDTAAPSVVSIVVSKDLPIIENCPYDPFSDLPDEFRQFFGEGLEFSRPCQRGMTKREIGGGSGFIVSDNGLILTNKHVVADAKAEYTVFTNDGNKYAAKVLASDPVHDLALIKIEATGLTSARLGDSDSVKLGQTAITIGNALGEFRNTVSVGVISGLARTVTAQGSASGAEVLQGVIQTDAAINPGNSGGPLLNLKGEVIGINTAMASGAENIGFAIPINQAKRAIESVKATGTIKNPFLGVRYTITDEGAVLGATDDGPAIIPDSPASKAGLKAGDVIQEINGREIDQDHSLGFLIQQYNIGDTVTLKIKRGEQILELKATLEERPEL